MRAKGATLAIAIPATFILAGCKDVPLTPSTLDQSALPTVEGFYLLESVNGGPRPATITTRVGFSLEIVDASFGILAPPNFRRSTFYKKTENGDVTSYLEICLGTYSYSGSGLPRFAGNFLLTETTVPNSGCGKEYSGRWDGTRTITIDFDSTTQAVYLK